VQHRFHLITRRRRRIHSNCARLFALMTWPPLTLPMLLLAALALVVCAAAAPPPDDAWEEGQAGAPPSQFIPDKILSTSCSRSSSRAARKIFDAFLDGVLRDTGGALNASALLGASCPFAAGNGLFDAQEALKKQHRLRLHVPARLAAAHAAAGSTSGSAPPATSSSNPKHSSTSTLTTAMPSTQVHSPPPPPSLPLLTPLVQAHATAWPSTAQS
jgi:hypothetical protein